MNIAILGCGTVGGGVIRLLTQNKEPIRRRVGEEITIGKVLARHPEKALALGLKPEQIVTDIKDILMDESIGLVVELIGGTKDAYTYIRQSLESGRHVVTANKDVIAEHLSELSSLAQENRVELLFEASVGGGIPLIGPLRQTLAANRIMRICGILNGTTNYILTQMTKNGLSYEYALKDAQKLGFAEADPSSDVEGADAARKIAILASLAFHSEVTYPQVYHEGITEITPTDIWFAKDQGYVPKLLAVAEERNGAVEIYVRPALVPESHPMAAVNDSFNAVYLTGDAVGKVMLYGRGAGADPTASSVVGDIMEITQTAATGSMTEDHSLLCEPKKVQDIRACVNTYYVRLLVEDRPKVLAGVAGALGDAGISIETLVQNPLRGNKAELMLLTHAASEQSLRSATAELLNREYVKEIHSMICMED